MDVFGKKPMTEKGSYFRANVWSWRPIHALIAIADARNGGRLVPKETMRLMCSNDGAGLKSQKACNALADALERLLARPCLITEHGLEIAEEDGQRYIYFPVAGSPLLSDGEGRLYTPEDAKKKGIKTLRSAYETSFDHVREFIAFLRSCGGFEVC